MKIRALTESVKHYNEQVQLPPAQYLVTDNKGRYFVLQYDNSKGSNPQHLKAMIDQKADELGFVGRTVVTQWVGDIDDEIAEAERLAQAYAAKKKTNPAQYYGNVKKATALKQAKEIMDNQSIEEENKLKRTNTDYEDQMDASHAQIYDKPQKPPARLMRSIAAAKAKRLARQNGTETTEVIDEVEADVDPGRAINKFLNKGQDLEEEGPKARAVGDRVKTRNIKTKRSRTEKVRNVSKNAHGLNKYELDSGRIVYDQDLEEDSLNEYKPGVTVLTRGISFNDYKADGENFDGAEDYATVKKIRWPYGIEVKFDDRNQEVTFKTAKMKTVAKILNKYIDFGAVSAGEILELPSELMMSEAVAKIACLECDEVSTAKAWQKNNGNCPKCNNSTKGVAEASYSDSGYRNMHKADQKANRQADKDRAKKLQTQKNIATKQVKR